MHDEYILRKRMDGPITKADWGFLLGITSFDGEMTGRHEPTYLAWAQQILDTTWGLHQFGSFQNDDKLFLHTLVKQLRTCSHPGDGHFAHAPSIRSLFIKLVTSL